MNSIVPPIKKSASASSDPDAENHPRHFPGSNMFMMACCALMFAVFGFVVFTAPAAQAWSTTLLSALPLVGCVAVHLVMHRFMGRSCHGAKTGPATEINTNPEITTKAHEGA